MSVVPGRPTLIQQKTIHLRTFEQHKLDLMGFIFKKEHRLSSVGEADVGGVERGK